MLITQIPVQQHFVRDSFVSAAVCGIMAVAYLKWLGWIAGVFMLSAILCVLLPDQAVQIFSCSTVAIFAIALLASWKTLKK